MLGTRMKRKIGKEQEDIKFSIYIEFCLQLPRCMYVFLTSFAMHGICMCFIGHDFQLAWRFAYIDSGFS